MLDLKSIRKQMYYVFGDREDYLKWVDEWKRNIKLIEAHIRMHKTNKFGASMRSPTWSAEYQNFEASRKLLRWDDDLIHSTWMSQQDHQLRDLRVLATAMYDIRVANKRRSYQMKKKLQEEAAAA